MSDKFDWHTEDNAAWDDSAPAPETAVSRSVVPRRHLWFTIAFILVGVAAAGAVLYWQVDKRIETTTDNVKRSVLAAHNLVQQASRQSDAELFNSLLSGRDPDWAEWQKQLMLEGALFERGTFGLDWLPPAGADSDAAGIEISLNSRLNAAEVIFAQEYAVAAGEGALTETVTLRQTAVYRRGGQRWLLSPPLQEFWGDAVISQGDFLTLIYPERDTAVAERLAIDLDARLDEMCRTLAGLNCPDGLRVQLRLDADLSRLIEIAGPAYALSGGLKLALPAPTLMGLPIDEAGYQALYRGYAAQLVTAVIADLVGYQCCDHAAFFQALAEHQLAQLGLRPSPAMKADYTRVVNEDVSIDDLTEAWRNSRLDYLTGEEGWRVYTAVDFLLQNFPNVGAAAMQREITGRPGYVRWLLALTKEAQPAADPTFLNNLTQTWWQFAFEQVVAGQSPPPIPLPEQDIYLLCLSDQGAPPAGLLYHYNWDAASWVQQPIGPQFSSMNPLPQDDGLLLQTLSFGAATSEISIWREGVTHSLEPDDLLSFGQFNPSGERLIVYGLQEEGIRWIDINSCVDGACLIEELAGLPLWSPQGTDFILRDALHQQVWPFYRGGAVQPAAAVADMIPIGSGRAPFWLDETTYGYIRQGPASSASNRRELALASTADDRLHSLFTEDDLLLALPEDERPSRLNMRYTAVHPNQPALLFVVALDGARQVYLFAYNRQTSEIQLRLQVGAGMNQSPSFSPDGRWLALPGFDAADGHGNQLFLHDVVHNKTEQFNTSPLFLPDTVYDWSADGQWLIIIVNQRVLTLAAPAYGYQQLIPHDLGNCANVVWLNR